MNKTIIVKCISVIYHNRLGGICPDCGKQNCIITRSVPWFAGEKLRYHKCRCGKSFSSIENELPLPAEPEPAPAPKPEPAPKRRQVTERDIFAHINDKEEIKPAKRKRGRPRKRR